LTIQIN